MDGGLRRLRALVWPALWLTSHLAASTLALAQPLEVDSRAVDVNGQPVAGADVSLYRSRPLFEKHVASLEGSAPEVIARSSTDDEGRFSLEVPEPGLWRLRFLAPGFVALEIRLEPLLEPLDLLPVALRRVVPCSVSVSDVEGKPIESATVWWQGEAKTRSDPRRSRTTRADTTSRTDERGISRGECQAEGDNTVIVAASSFLPALASVGEDPTRVVLERASEGRVLELGAECRQEPCLVLLEPHASPSHNASGGRLPYVLPWIAHGLTDGQARALVPLRSNASNRVRLLAASGAAAEIEVTSGREPLAVVLERTEISGTVMEAESETLIADALVWSTLDPASVMRTRADGSYSLAVPLAFLDDRFMSTLRTAKRGYAQRATRQPTRVGAQDGRAIPLLLEPLGRIEGSVVDADDEPVAAAELFLEAEGKPPPSGLSQRPSFWFSRSRSDGAFVMPEAPLGRSLALKVRRRGFAPTTVQVPALARNGTRTKVVELRLMAGTRAFGAVVDENELPVSGALVRLARARKSGSLVPGLGPPVEEIPDSFTDTNGRFELTDLSPGRYDLGARAPGFAPAEVPGVALPADERDFEIGTIVLSPGEEIAGRVLDPDGRPIAGATIRVRGGFGLSSLRRLDEEPSAESDDGGRFLIDGLAPKSCEATVERDGFVSRSLRGIRIPGEPIEVILDVATSLAGVVVDVDGVPVAGAQVVAKLRHQEGLAVGLVGVRRMRALTDGEGRFALRGLTADVWNLSASHVDHAPVRREGLELEVGQVTEVRLVLPEPASLSGQIVNSRGEPVSEARVTVRHDPTGSENFYSSHASDSDGRYSLEGVAPGNMALIVSHARYPEIIRHAVLEAGENSFDIELDSGLEIAGLVVDEVGAPVAEALVYASGSGHGPPSRRVTVAGERPRTWVPEQPGTGRTNAEGRFTLPALTNGTYSVVARKEGYATAESSPVVLDSESVSGVELRLETGGVITGHVLGVELDELSAVRVSATTPGRSSGSSSAVDHEGRFRLEHLSPGDWLVEARARSGRKVHERVTVDEGAQEVEVVLELTRGLALRGRVLLDGEPLLGAAVRARPAFAGNGPSALCDQSGGFLLEDLEPGDYQLTVALLDRHLVYDELITLDADREITLDLVSTLIRGRVFDRTSDIPIEGAEVSLRGEAAAAAGGGYPNRSWRTNSEGRFEASAFQGSYRLQAQARGFAASEVRLDVVAGEAEVEVPLEPSTGLWLEIRRPLGAAVKSRVHVALFDGSGSVRSIGTYTPSAGRLHLTELPQGRLDLLVSESNGGVAETVVEVSGEPVPVVLPDTGVLAVTVTDWVDRDGAAMVQLFDSQGRLLRRLAGSRVVDRWQLIDGAAVVSGVPIGEWTVRVRSEDGEQWTGTARIEARATFRLGL